MLMKPSRETQKQVQRWRHLKGQYQNRQPSRKADAAPPTRRRWVLCCDHPLSRMLPGDASVSYALNGQPSKRATNHTAFLGRAFVPSQWFTVPLKIANQVLLDQSELSTNLGILDNAPHKRDVKDCGRFVHRFCNI